MSLKHKRIIERLLLFAVGITCFKSAVAQNADSLHTQARKAAFEMENYAEAIRLTKAALEQMPNNTEYLISLGRLYTWNKQADSARIYFNKALELSPDNIEALKAFANLEYWEDSKEAALGLSEKALLQNGQDKDLLLLKAQILYAMKRYSESLEATELLLKKDGNNTRGRALAALIRDNISKNRVGLKYDYVYFDKQFPNPWQFICLDYTFQSKAGAYTARVNYANRFRTNGLQFEAEAYPRISRRFYAYLNIGYSETAAIFPKWKGGASLFANLPAAFEAELGVRYLYFNKDALIYTAYLGKYLGSFLLGARTYLAPNENNIAETYSILARYYFGGADDYLGLNLGAGISPDDQQRNVQLNSIYKLKTYRAELSARRAIKKLNVLLLNFSVAQQEYLPGKTGMQIQAGLGYIRRF